MESFNAHRAHETVGRALSELALRGRATFPAPHDSQEQELVFRLISAHLGFEPDYVQGMLDNSLTGDSVASRLVPGLRFSKIRSDHGIWFTLRSDPVAAAA